jgi:ubiquinone/menaquinone biosynthesis C-methylase UbiE
VNEGSKLEEIVQKVMHLVEGNSILDVGTGFGTVISQLLKRNVNSVTSIDPEAWSFEQIKNVYSEEISTGRLKLLQARAEEMPFDDNSFDTTMAICSLHHVKNTLEGIREIERVTSDRLIITDWNPSSSGIYNPHTPEDLLAVKEVIFQHASKNGYSFSETEMWYFAWR